jgi:hypothetical protein
MLVLVMWQYNADNNFLASMMTNPSSVVYSVGSGCDLHEGKALETLNSSSLLMFTINLHALHLECHLYDSW